MENNSEKICKFCGKQILSSAVFCPGCGSQIEVIKVTQVKPRPIITPKSKTSAVLYAILFGAWSWLYTYGKNSKKFWVSIILFFGIGLITISYGCSTIFSEYPAPPINYPIIYLVHFVGTWLWAIIDNAVRPRSFYEKYPLG